MSKNRLTQSIVFSLVTLVASLNWYFLHKAFYCLNCGIYTLWIIPVLSFVILFALIGISWFLVNSKTVIFVNSAAIIVSYLLVYGFEKIILGVAIVCLFLIYFASSNVLKEKYARKRIDFAKVFRHGMPMIVFAVALLVSVAYYYSPKISNLEDGIDASQVEYIDEVAIGIIKKSNPDLDVEMTVDDFLKNFVQSSQLLQANPMLMQILGLKESELMDSSIVQLRRSIAGNFDLSLTGDENMLVLISNAIVARINNLFKNYYHYISIAMAAGVFFAIKFFGSLLIGISLMLSWLAFRLLVRFGAIIIEIDQEPVEVIKL